MQGYSNYNNQNGFGGANVNRNYAGVNGVTPMNVGNNVWNNGWGYQPNNYNQGFNQVPMQQVGQGGRIYVTGRAGADAFQMPQGVTEVILWDDDERRFYIKGYDEKGRPRVLEDNDYQGHIDSEPAQRNIDMSNYATKDDIKNLMSEVNKKGKTPNMNGYVTVEDLNKALSELCVGSGGKVVRSGESDV